MKQSIHHVGERTGAPGTFGRAPRYVLIRSNHERSSLSYGTDGCPGSTVIGDIRPDTYSGEWPHRITGKISPLGGVGE